MLARQGALRHHTLTVLLTHLDITSENYPKPQSRQPVVIHPNMLVRHVMGMVILVCCPGAVCGSWSSLCLSRFSCPCYM